MKAQYLPIFLKDEALTWYHRDATRKNKHWLVVKQELQAHFRPTGYIEHRVAELHRRKLRDGESINDYHNAIMRMYDILEQCGKNYTDREKAQKMVRGLPINYRITMTLARVATPQEFLDAAGEIVDVLETKKRRDVGDGFDMPNDIPLANIFDQDSTRKNAWPFKENTRNSNQDRSSEGNYNRQKNGNAYRYGNGTYNNTYRNNQTRGRERYDYGSTNDSRSNNYRNNTDSRSYNSRMNGDSRPNNYGQGYNNNNSYNNGGYREIYQRNNGYSNNYRGTRNPNGYNNSSGRNNDNQNYRSSNETTPRFQSNNNDRNNNSNTGSNNNARNQQDGRNNNASTDNRNNKPRTIECYKCGKEGHIATQCAQNTQNTTDKATTSRSGTPNDDSFHN